METPVVKILRRRGPPANLSQDAVIQKNLQPLKENIQKKQRAQEAYYQHNSTMIGSSPMVRDLNRQPVQQRLGRKVPFNGTNTSMVPPKKRLYKNSTLNNSINKRKTLKRTNYAQMRLNRIRERQRESLLLDDNPNAIKRIKLRRMVANVTPTNLQVQFRNNGAYLSNQLHGIKRHRIVLDQDIQLSINQLKEMYSGEKISIFKVTPKATTVYLNDRFNNLS